MSENLGTELAPSLKRGPKRGSKHAGMFKAGHDPRRLEGGISAKLKMQERMDFHPLVPSAVETLKRLMQDDQPAKVALEAAQTVLDRVFGKAVATSVTATTKVEDIKMLSTNQLNAIAYEALATPNETLEVIGQKEAHVENADTD